MNLDDIQSGDDYAKILIEDMERVQESIGGNGLNSTIFENWCKKVEVLCKKSYRDYEKGRKESFKLSDEEMSNAYEEAVNDYTDTLLEGLIDKGLVEMAVSDTGEIVYGLSDKGRGYANMIKDLIKDNDEDDFEN